MSALIIILPVVRIERQSRADAAGWKRQEFEREDGVVVISAPRLVVDNEKPKTETRRKRR